MVKGDKVKKIIFLTHANPQGYRIQQYFPYLEDRGFDVELITSKTHIIRFLARLRSADVIYIQRLLFDPIKLSFIRGTAKRLIYDFDDAVMFGTKGESPTRRRKFKNMVMKADAVLCGNHFLLEEAKRYNEKNIYYVPTVVDVKDYPIKIHEERQVVTGGWIGSTSTLKYLDTIRYLFLNPSDIGNMRFKIIADKAPDIVGRYVLFERWEMEKEKDALLSLDIGFMPLSDDIWSRGKCGLKLIQYMATGLPSVTHPVGVANQMIEDGVNGFLRADTEGWIEATRQLAKDAKLRQKMGKAARDITEQRYSLHIWGKRVAKIIDSL